MTKVLKVIPLLLALVLLASVPAVISAKTENSSGALRTTVGQVAPSVSATASPGAQVRLNSPVSVTVTFSEPVSGFTVDDITVVNGTASSFSGSDGDAVYTFDVTPNSLGEVTVDIAAGVATDSDGAGNTPAPRLSLGIPYDFDGNGGISRAETIAAIRDYFGGNITRAQAIAVIRLYFSAPTGPGPGPSDDCIQTVSSDGTLNGQWASGCDSETRSGSHARYYTFTLDASSQVTIRLESSAANTHLYLRREDATSGTALHENDDHEGSISVSQIQETLAADTYTVEATTYAAGSTGSFTLSISGLSGTTPTDPALLRYAAEKAGGPGAIYVGDINQLVGPVVGPVPGDRYSRSSLGDDDGMVPLYALQDHLWLYESDYYQSLIERANLRKPTGLTSTGESIEVQHVCINTSLLPCRLIELYWAPNLEARTNGQLKLVVSSFPELGLNGPDTLQLVSDGTLSMANIYHGYVVGKLPAIEVQSLWGIYPDWETMYLSLTDMHPQLEAMVAEETGGGIIVNHNWYSGNDQFLFTRKALRTLADFEGLKTRSHSQALSDWIRGMGAEARFVAFSEVYTALERGILDAGVTGATPGYGQRWYEVAGYLNGPLRGLLSSNNVINADVWDEIPADLQQIFIEEGAKAELEQLRLTSIQNVIGVQKNIDAGMTLVEFSPELAEHSFDVAVVEHVIPGWLNRVGYPGKGDNAVATFNEHVGPYVGLRIESDGSVGQVPVIQGPHSENTRGDCAPAPAAEGATTGSWTSFCTSVNRSGSYVRYYTFTTGTRSNVTVTLESSDADTYLYLLQGKGAYGTVLHENNDHSGTDSQIEEILDPGSYTVEATTYSSGVPGDFTLTITVSDADEPEMVTLPTDPALLRYAAEKAGGPGAIYVDDINQLVGPAPGDRHSRSSLGDDNGMVPLYALQDHLWLYESDYYQSLIERANLRKPTGLTSTGESIEVQHACVNPSLLPCRLIELYWAPNLEARTNGQLKLVVSSFPELGVAGSDTLQLVSDGTLSMADIYPGYVAGKLPAFEVQSLWGIYPDWETMYLSLTGMHPQLEAMVAEATGGGIIVNHNWYSGNDQFLFSKKALRTLADFEGLKTRSHSAALSDWIQGMGAEARFVFFTEVYTALERGILDAGVTGATPGYGQRWYEVSRYLNGPLRGLLSSNNVINADVWDEIPADLQQIFIEEGAKAELEQLRLTSIQNVIGVQRIIDAGMTLVEFSPELAEHSFDVAVIEHVIPGWLNRVGYPGQGDNAVATFNEHVGPYVGLRIESDGSVAQVPISQGPHAGNTMEQVLTR